MKIRRLVTGHTAEGNSTIVKDAQLEAEVLATRPGWAVAKLWAADAPARFPDEGVGQVVDAVPAAGRLPLLHHDNGSTAGAGLASN